MSNLAKQLVMDLQSANEDFEWYPTTDEMINAVSSDILSLNGYYRLKSLLDVGCGDGRVLEQISKTMISHSCYLELYGVEKAQTHLNKLLENDKISVVGTDFHETNFMNKQAAVYFCNPPYSEFEHWVSTLLNTAYATLFYFVIPERWVNSKLISQALERREMQADIIYTGDFTQADRQARAKVNIVRVAFKSAYKINHWDFRRAYGRDATEQELISDKPCITELNEDNDPFDVFFDEMFKLDLAENYNDKSQQDNEHCKEVFAKSHTIAELVEWYNKDLTHLQLNYGKLSELDASLFKTLGVNLATLKDSVKTQFKDLRQRYWLEFLNFYEPIHSRLTRKNRDLLTRNLFHGTLDVDFTERNLYFITEKVLNFAQTQQEQQVIDFYLKLADNDNIRAYKSNEKLFSGNNFRYNKQKETHWKLDYRIVSYCYGTSANKMSGESFGAYKLNDTINDLLIIFKTLGIELHDPFLGVQEIEYGKKYYAEYVDPKTNRYETAIEMKFHRNGNVHYRFNKKLMLMLNVTAGRLLGWLNNPQQTADELGEKETDVADVWATRNSLEVKNLAVNNALPYFGER